MTEHSLPPADVYIAMWCTEGLEYLENMSDFEKKVTMALLSGKAKPSPPPLEMMKLRARVNSQRVYEIYVFPVAPTISEDALREMFEQDPQPLVEWIRENGEKVYSDHHPAKPRQLIY